MTRWSAVAWALAVILVLVGVLLAAAPAIGLERSPVLSAVLPARSALTAAAIAALVVAVAASAWRGARPLALPVAAGLGVIVALHAPVLRAHGVHDEPVAAPAAGQLRVLEWNTNGALVRDAVVARLAAEQDADVVVLPHGALQEATSAGASMMLAGYRRAFADAGLPVVLETSGAAGAQVVVALTPRLAGHYTAEPGPDPVKTLALQPDDAALPSVLALHAPLPVGAGLDGWRADLQWVARECAAGGSGGGVLVAGDLNASVDAFPGPALGGCRDAAPLRGGAAVGTWPTRLPTVLAMPIDHVLSTPGVGRVASFTVLRSQDGSGARHRPTMTVITTGR